MKSTGILCAAVMLSLVGPWLPRAVGQGLWLFDGKTLDGWVTRQGQPVTKGWEVVDGTIHLNPASGRGGNIVTDRLYRDFDLHFQWKIAPGGNSGIKYRVRTYGNQTLGCEYQILGDQPRRVSPPSKGSTGSLYDVYPPSAQAYVRPAGQFNDGRIVVCGNHIEHWLNGVRILEAQVGSREWRRRIADSKFADVEGFGENRWGKIMLTDHNSEVWYRNLLMYPVWPTEPAPSGYYIARPRCRLLRIFRRPVFRFRRGCW